MIPKRVRSTIPFRAGQTRGRPPVNNKPLLIFGAGGHAKVVADIARLCGREVVGFLDDVSPERNGEKFFGATILGGIGRIAEIKRMHKGLEVVVGIGDCKARSEIASSVEHHGLTLATLLHPMAILSKSVKVGEGSVVAAGAVVNAASRIGKNVILNTGSSVDHDCRIASGTHIGPGAVLGGNVVVGEQTWIGLGAIIKDGISIGRSCVVGAGALVLKDVPDCTVSYGSPATAVRKNR